MIDPRADVEPSESELAPRWHTAALVALTVAVAAAGALLSMCGSAAPVAPGPRGLGVYAPLLVVQWGLLFYVCRVGRRRSALRALLGEPWRTAKQAAVDGLLALAGWGLILGCEAGWRALFGPRVAGSVAAMLPHTPLERLAWVVVAASVGFCEEVVYRGYLQTQLTAYTGRVSAGIALQAVLFGLAHGEQGAAVAARFAVYGAGFGALARLRRSLLPCIVCHVWTDALSGLWRP